jgi:hypothetical protein
LAWSHVDASAAGATASISIDVHVFDVDFNRVTHVSQGNDILIVVVNSRQNGWSFQHGVTGHLDFSINLEVATPQLDDLWA